MLSKRALMISPVLSIAAVTSALLGAALYVAAAPTDPGVYIAEVQPADRGTVNPLLVEHFPDYFQGYFHWDGETRADQQNVGLDVHEVALNSEGLIVATGRATYNTNYRNIDFSFRIEVNPLTNEFVMWESEPNKSGFVTTGRHVANIVSYDEVHATWIGDDGDRGVLKLWPAEGSMRFFSDDVGDDAPHRRATHLQDGVWMQKGKMTGANCASMDSDELLVEWSGRGTDGSFVDTTRDDLMQTLIPAEVSPGWTIALLNLCAGETARVWMPAEMVDGGDEFAPGGHVMFDIDVRQVTHPTW